MGNETMEWYNRNCLTGFADIRGRAWHDDAVLRMQMGWEDNAYPGAIPLEDVLRRLFHWQAVSGEVYTRYYDEDTDTEVELYDPTRQTVIRPDTKTVLGLQGESYQIHQHDEWLVDGASAIIDTSKSDIGIANAIMLKGGAIAAVQYELPDTITMHGDIRVRPSLLATGSMNGSLKTGYHTVVNNVVCDNTMNAALMTALASYLVKHTKHSMTNITNAQEALNLLFTIEDVFRQETGKMLSIKLTGKDFAKYLDEVAFLPADRIDPTTGKPMSNKAVTMVELKREKLLTLWLEDERVAPWKGSAYGIWQLTNTYNHHVVGTNGDTIRGERNMIDVATGKFAKADRAAMDILFDKVLHLDYATI